MNRINEFASARYSITISQGAVCLQDIAERGCTKRVHRDTGRYLVFCIMVLSLFSMGSGMTFILSLLLLLFTGVG